MAGVPGSFAAVQKARKWSRDQLVDALNVDAVAKAYTNARTQSERLSIGNPSQNRENARAHPDRIGESSPPVAARAIGDDLRFASRLAAIQPNSRKNGCTVRVHAQEICKKDARLNYTKMEI